MDDFIWRALAAGCGVALVAGALGCFVVWRRMAYFSDSLSHSALLGIAMGLLYDFNVSISLFVVCFLFAVALVWLQQKRQLAPDTVLGILAHTALSAGIVIVSLIDEHRSIDLYSYLFGDILTVQSAALYWVFAGASLVLLLLVLHWPSLVLMTLHEGLARAEGVRPLYSQLVFMFLMTVFVAMSIRVVGILLITSLLIIPAAAARQFVRVPESMAWTASGLGIMSVIVGVFVSIYLDAPTGPTIVVIAAMIFLLVLGLSFSCSKALTLRQGKAIIADQDKGRPQSA